VTVTQRINCSVHAPSKTHAATSAAVLGASFDRASYTLSCLACVSPRNQEIICSRPRSFITLDYKIAKRAGGRRPTGQESERRVNRTWSNL